MFRTVIYYTGLGLGLVKILIYIPKCNRLIKNGDIKAADSIVTRIVTRWAQRRIKASGAKLNIKGLENIPTNRTVMFVANHQSDFDIMVILGKIPVQKAFVAKKELGKVPLLGFWMKRVHCLFMDRSDMKQSMQTIIKAYEQLKEGYNMVIFPEGTRSKGGPVKEFKAGSFKPAVKAKVPVIPITLDGTYKVIEANPHNSIVPADVNVVIHPMIETAELTKEEIKELPSRVHDIITSAMENKGK